MPGKALIVDDSDDARTILGLRLEQAGFEVGTAASGKECLDAVEAQCWDVVLLDIMMPLVIWYVAFAKSTVRLKSPSSTILIAMKRRHLAW
jgi:CheY-like chemotaxis protein